MNDAGIRLSTQTIFTSPSAYSNNANPVLSVTLFAHPNGIRKQIVGIWKEPAASGLNAGLYWYAASYDNSGFAINTPCNQIVNTNVESANPTIDVFKNDDAAYGGGQLLFHYAWEDHYNVRYQKIVCGLSGVTISGPFPALVASFGCPYPWHSLPSIAAISNSQAGLSWRAYYSDGVEFDESHAVFRFIDNGVINRFWFFGNYISSATINKNYDDLFGETSYAVGWTEVSGSAYSNFAVKNSGLTTPINLQCTGRDMQLCNANDFSSQRGIALGTASPYAFQSTAIVDPNWLGKNSSAHISAGRMGIVASGDAQFYFAIGDISVDGNAIDFKSLIDTVQIATMEDYKSYLISDPFTITDNSHFLYSVKYGVKDSTEALAALAQNPSVHFTVELIDDHTKQVIGKYDDVSYSLSHMQPHKNIAYEMNSKGIGNKTVRLRLSVLTTLADAQYALADMRAGSGSALNKITIERVKGTVTGLNPVTEYAIGQNYPNPFNPSTTISYAIPQPCTVNIKVYDMLGKEVATLVNEYKPSGRYEVSFNASQLSSGMYIYRIQAGSYTATKKMQLLK